MSDSSRRLGQIESQFHGSAPAYNDDDSMATASPPPRPPFSSLPLDKNGPGRNCWGLFGPDDQLGQLNYITPDVTKAAGKEIIDGTRIALDIPIDFLRPPSFNRMAPKHEILKLGDAGRDDVVHFNTQAGTQWDGFRHVGYHEQKKWYNGTTAEEIAESNKLGTQAWVKAGGFATRGVLLDFRRWADQNNKHKPPFEKTPITLSDLKSVIATQNTPLRTGDVLIIRTGFLADYGSLSQSTITERHTRADPPTIGLEQSDEMIRWIWESGVVAVASDAPALECWPWPMGSGNVLHENMLAGWGMPIGEYFDTERLGRECEKAGRWSFFFSSMPLHVNGGVGTPVNGIAIL